MRFVFGALHQNSELREALMGTLCRTFLAVMLAAGLAPTASAQVGTTGQSSGALPNAPDVLTGKERLGRKWMDEQRIDNCKVPIEKRGTRPRSSICPHVPMG